jgi:hypothetical protein
VLNAGLNEHPIAEAPTVRSVQGDPIAPANSMRDSTNIIMEIGRMKQSVGNLTGGQLYNSIFRAIYELCPDTDSSKVEQCDTDRTTRINGIEFKSLDGVIMKTGYLEVGAELSMNDTYNKEAIKPMVVNTIASTFQNQSVDPKNCEKVAEQCPSRGCLPRSSEESEKLLCSVSSIVSLHFENSAPIHMTVSLKFHDGIDEAPGTGDIESQAQEQFQCKAVAETAEEILRENVGALEKAMGIDGGKAQTEGRCTK